MSTGISRIDGVPIEREETPSSVADLASIMKEAHAHDRSMVAIGGGTELHLGNPPRSAQLALHTGQLRGVVEYEPGNLTVSMRAGTTLQEIQEILGRENQFLPLDPPCQEPATIGGLLATNASGPIRFRYSTARDMLIGIKIVHADGTETHAGGKLVKNVTGYDMCKLYAGSLGTLGIFSELTFKVQPKSEALATGIVAYPGLHAALEAAQACLHADLAPDAMEAWNDLAFESLTGDAKVAPRILMLRFGETDTAVRWQVDRLRELVLATGGVMLGVLGTGETEEFWRRVAAARAASSTGAGVWLKCSALYQSACSCERRMIEFGERMQARTRLFCHAGTIIIHGRYDWPDGARTPVNLRREIADLRRHCVSAGGHLVVEKAPREVKQGLDVWGYEAPALDLMRGIKKQFDPKGLLNPGRFVGGI